MRPVVRKKILNKFNNKCFHCNSAESLEVDHIIPLCRGGLHNEDNMQILCKKCNLKKGRGIDFKKYFKIGVNKEYILLSKDFKVNWFKPAELSSIIFSMLNENDELMNG